MPSSHFQMWGMLLLMGFGALVGPLIHGDLMGSIRAAFPSDESKRSALHRCGEMDAEFSRFLQRDRDVCYRVLHAPRDMASAPID